MALLETKLVGNLLEIREAGQNKVLALSIYQSSRNYSEKPMDIMTFARSADQVAKLQAMLDEANKDYNPDDKKSHRKAVQNVQVIARVDSQTNDEGFTTGVQVQLQRVLSANGVEFEQVEAEPAK
jgi:hypothetical protein